MNRELFHFVASVTDAGFPVTDAYRLHDDPESWLPDQISVEFGGRFVVSATPDGITYFDVETCDSFDIETPAADALPEFLNFCHERKN